MKEAFRPYSREFAQTTAANSQGKAGLHRGSCLIWLAKMFFETPDLSKCSSQNVLDVGGGDLIGFIDRNRSLGKMSGGFLEMPEAGCDLRLHRLRS
jgi:hypothetical protein